MDLDDLRIEVGTQDLRRLSNQLEKHVDADAHVGRDHRARAWRQVVELAALCLIEAGRADDDGSSLGNRGSKVSHRRVGDSEIERHGLRCDDAVVRCPDRNT
jgi:hypothetical protein